MKRTNSRPNSHRSGKSRISAKQNSASESRLSATLQTITYIYRKWHSLTKSSISSTCQTVTRSPLQWNLVLSFLATPIPPSHRNKSLNCGPTLSSSCRSAHVSCDRHSPRHCFCRWEIKPIHRILQLCPLAGCEKKCLPFFKNPPPLLFNC